LDEVMALTAEDEVMALTAAEDVEVEDVEDVEGAIDI